LKPKKEDVEAGSEEWTEKAPMAKTEQLWWDLE
jgi:hypothetical protein